MTWEAPAIREGPEIKDLDGTRNKEASKQASKQER
jgi:hypothetical protein